VLAHVDGISISTAARATSAAPTYLPQVEFPECGPASGNDCDGTGHQQLDKRIVFWDGGLLNNNPIEQLWTARYDLVGAGSPAPRVALVLSLGCTWNTAAADAAATAGSKGIGGVRSALWRFFDLLGRLSDFMTNTEAKNRDFQRYANVMRGRGDENSDIVYQRLNVPTGKELFDMADYTCMDRLKYLTHAYLQGKEAEDKIKSILHVLVPQSNDEVKPGLLKIDPNGD
jgi:hypothetical protein